MAAPDPLLQPLFTEEDRVKRADVDAILRRGPELAPALVGILQDDAVWEDEESPAGWAVIHAAYLLASLRPPGSLEVLLKAVERALDTELELICEAAPHLLAAYGPAALPGLRAAAEDVDRDPYARIFANEAVALIAWTHPEARAGALDLLRASVDDPACDQEVRAFAAGELLDFALPEDRRRIAAAADDDILSEETIDATYAEGPGKRELFDWMTFYDPEEIEQRQTEGPEDEDADSEEAAPEAGPAPLQPGSPAGRNDPCPCGSGKKYKKCCLS